MNFISSCYMNLYHYTNFAGLYGMLNGFDTEKHPYLTMWATNASFLNDNSEYTFGEEISRKAFINYESEIGIPHDKCLFNGHGHSGVIKKDKLNALPYIVSFCMINNIASMWDMYSMNGNGVAIIIDEDKIKNIDSSVMSSPCIYCSDENDLLQNKDLMDSMYEHFAHNMSYSSSGKVDPSIERIGRSWALLHTMAPRVKHISYASECEYRLIKMGVDNPKFRIRKDMIIPYKEVYVPIEAVKGFIIGPTADFEYMRLSLEMYLTSKGISDFDSNIIKSEVPYRG